MDNLQIYLNPKIRTVLTRRYERNLQQHRNILYRSTAQISNVQKTEQDLPHMQGGKPAVKYIKGPKISWLNMIGSDPPIRRVVIGERHRVFAKSQRADV